MQKLKQIKCSTSYQKKKVMALHERRFGAKSTWMTSKETSWWRQPPPISMNLTRGWCCGRLTRLQHPVLFFSVRVCLLGQFFLPTQLTAEAESPPVNFLSLQELPLPAAWCQPAGLCGCGRNPLAAKLLALDAQLQRSGCGTGACLSLPACPIVLMLCEKQESQVRNARRPLRAEQP